MGDLSRNLNRYEIECPCPCGVDTFDYETANVIQACVDHLQVVYPELEIGLHVNSGNRCKEYNSSIKGSSKTSKHTEYRALDFYLYDKKSGDYNTGHYINDNDVYDYLNNKYPDKYGIGRYAGRTHFDSRSVRSRWDKRQQK